MRAVASQSGGARSTLTVIVAAGLSLHVACGRNEMSTEMSATQHTIDEPTRGTEAWMWSSVSEAEYRSIMLPLLGLASDDILPSDHKLTERTQMWIDRIDSTIRAQHADQLANVPKPFARVKKTPIANAFVAPIPVCYKLPVKLAARRANFFNTVRNFFNTVGSVIVDPATGELSAWPSQLRCKAGSEAVATLESFADRFNELSNDCKITITANGEYQPNEACSIAEDLAGAVAAKSIVLLQTANVITVHTGLFELMSEEAFVGVLAHELGHYYRAHSTGHASEFDFFYTMDLQHNPTQRPVADPALEQVGERAIIGSTILSASDTHLSFEGQTLRSELYFAVGSAIRAVCDEGDCSEACRVTNDKLKDINFAQAMASFPFGTERDSQEAAYREYENEALACLATIELATTTDTLSATSISWDRFISYVRQPIWPSWLGRLSSSGQRYLAGMFTLAAARSGDGSGSAENLSEAVQAASQAFAAQDSQSELFLREAYDKQVGYYTAEQEADDEAAEWMANIGFDPKHTVDAMARLGAGERGGLRGLLLGDEECKALRSAGWAGTDGVHKFVPIGDYSEVHHSACFRMFNLEREIAAHKHEAASASLPAHGGAVWLEFQSLAADLGEESLDEAENASVFAINPILQKNSLLQCPYASALKAQANSDGTSLVGHISSW